VQVTYDPEADVLYVRLRPAPVADTTTLDEQGVARNVAIDLDAQGEVIGFEITGASRLDGSDLDNFAVALRHRKAPAETAE